MLLHYLTSCCWCRYPLSRAGGSSIVYSASSDSAVSVEIFASLVDAPTAAELYLRPRVLLLDEESPSVDSCPSNIVQNIATNTNTVNLAWSPPLFSDARAVVARTGPDAAASLFSLLPPGSPTAQVVYTASDLFGNVAVCNFSVTLVDLFRPTATFVSSLAKVLPANNSQVIVPVAEWLPSALRDNSNFNVTVLQPDPSQALTVTLPGSFFDVVIADVYDNRATRRLTISVTDTTPPVVVCPTLNPVVTRPDADFAVVDWDLRTPTDNYAPPNYTLSHQSGARFPLGTTTVALTATDLSGNENRLVMCRVIRTLFSNSAR